MVLALILFACDSGTTDPTDTGTAVAPTTRSVEDVFVQSTLDPVDFLWVLDPTWRDGFDSLEAARETGYKALRLAGTDFRMGFTSADIQNPVARGVIRGQHETIFPSKDVWFLPPGNEFTPAPLDAIAAVFGEDRFQGNEDFFREDAHLQIMVLTNTRDASDVTVNRIKRVFDDLVEDGITNSVRISAILSANEQIVADWTRLTDEFDGTTFSVGSWDRGIEAIYQHGINQRREFPLTEFPMVPPRDVIVTYRERNTVQVLGEDYDYIASRNLIRFRLEAPEVGSTIRVPYSVPLE